MSKSRLLPVIALLLGAIACPAQTPPPSAPAAAVKTLADHFDIAVGKAVVHMQLAVYEPEMQRGLMERRDLGADEGMIFVYAAPEQLNFWMRNTPTPLDIGFFRPDGVLAEIYPLLPYDERTVASRSQKLQFALEMHQGWYASHDVHPGDRLDLKALSAALKARGFDPAKFGLAP